MVKQLLKLDLIADLSSIMKDKQAETTMQSLELGEAARNFDLNQAT